MKPENKQILDKIGDLSTLNTINKSSLVNAINEIKTDYATDIGIANAYKITLIPTPTSYEIGKIYKFKAVNANTGVSTFQIGSLIATTIKKNVSTDLASGDIAVGQIVQVVYDGTYFQFLGVTNAERTTWNAKQSALGYTPLNKAGDTVGGIITAQSNTSYTTRQIHNVILSTASANVGSMQNGDIWIQYI